MQEALQPPVAGRIMRGVYCLVVLAKELGAFLLGQVPQNNLGVIRILNLDWLGGHAIQNTPGPGRWPPRSGPSAWPVTARTARLTWLLAEVVDGGLDRAEPLSALPVSRT